MIVLGASGNVGVASVKALLAKEFLKGNVVAGVRNADPANPKNAGIEGAQLVVGACVLPPCRYTVARPPTPTPIQPPSASPLTPLRPPS